MKERLNFISLSGGCIGRLSLRSDGQGRLHAVGNRIDENVAIQPFHVVLFGFYNPFWMQKQFHGRASHDLCGMSHSFMSSR